MKNNNICECFISFDHQFKIKFVINNLFKNKEELNNMGFIINKLSNVKECIISFPLYDFETNLSIIQDNIDKLTALGFVIDFKKGDLPEYANKETLSIFVLDIIHYCHNYQIDEHLTHPKLPDFINGYWNIKINGFKKQYITVNNKKVKLDKKQEKEVNKYISLLREWNSKNESIIFKKTRISNEELPFVLNKIILYGKKSYNEINNYLKKNCI